MLKTAEKGEILGWFDWNATYDRAVETAPPGSILVEVGVFLGKSLFYLAERARDANKGLRIVGVDHWLGSPEFENCVFYDGRPITEQPPGFMLSLCYGELVNRGLHRDVKLLVSDSADAARLFADQSIHMAFIDAAHDEDSVLYDIGAWLPKVRPGGIIAGHDYYTDGRFPGVRKAVDTVFGDRVVVSGVSWEVQV